MSLETFKETKERNPDEKSKKKQRASGADAIAFIKEKIRQEGIQKENELEFKKQEMELKKDEIELERRLRQEELEMRRKEFEERNNMNMALLQQQQQQTNALLTLLQKFASK